MILAISDDVWKAAIGAVVTIVLAWFAFKLNSIAKVADKTHILVNSSMGIQLKLNADNARRVADFSNLLVDIKAADLAEEMLREHQTQQAIVDAKEHGKTK